MIQGLECTAQAHSGAARTQCEAGPKVAALGRGGECVLLDFDPSSGLWLEHTLSLP